jgi:hypothetical protein
MRRLPVIAIGAPLALVLATASMAEVGTVASVDGTAEIQHAGAWEAARIGGPVNVGDSLRTGRPGRMRVVFQDDTVLNVGDESFLVVDRQVFDPEVTGARSLMRLLRGKVRALVSEYYQEPGAAYEIETDTAVAGVRGTEFVIAYDPTLLVTEVVGVSGRVEVHSVLDRARRGVYVTARELATVRKGDFPTGRPHLDDDTLRQYLEGLDFIGFGRPESLTANHPLPAGSGALPPERAPAVTTLAAAPTSERPERDASTLIGQPPGVVRELTGDLSVGF